MWRRHTHSGNGFLLRLAADGLGWYHSGSHPLVEKNQIVRLNCKLMEDQLVTGSTVNYSFALYLEFWEQMRRILESRSETLAIGHTGFTYHWYLIQLSLIRAGVDDIDGGYYREYAWMREATLVFSIHTFPIIIITLSGKKMCSELTRALLYSTKMLKRLMIPYLFPFLPDSSPTAASPCWMPGFRSMFLVYTCDQISYCPVSFVLIALMRGEKS